MTRTTYSTAVEAVGLRKRYGRTEALRGLDLAVPVGTVCGLLGPNGAGKTTAVKVLTTLVRPDGGQARVAGVDVVRHPDQVRRRIGLAGQHAAVDEKITGRENLRLFGRLHHLGERRARAVADELLERFGLGPAAGRLVATYSGGMRRRLDLAASLLVTPDVLFLDEPTTGLDPRSRGEVWDAVRELVRTGTTVLLTTQYLEEADRLADRIAVVDAGRVIASGTPPELKSQVGGDRLEVVVTDPAALPAAAAALTAVTGVPAAVEPELRRVSGPAGRGSAALTDAVLALQAGGIGTDDVTLRRPTLDDVFLRLTGTGTGAAAEPEAVPA
jgi:ABC-2 type transport system ATP-binding protein